MTSKKECYLCAKLHSEQFLKDTDTLYTCDEHTYITMKQVSNLFQLKKETVWRYARKGWLTRYILGKKDVSENHPGATQARYALIDVKELIEKREVK